MVDFPSPRHSLTVKMPCYPIIIIVYALRGITHPIYPNLFCTRRFFLKDRFSGINEFLVIHKSLISFRTAAR